MIQSGIYIIKNSANGKFYIGSAVDVRDRWRCHKKNLRAGNHRNAHLQRAWVQDGEQSFIFEVLLYCEKENTLFFEQRALDRYFACLPTRLYNLNRCAASPLGRKLSDQTKAKLRAANLGKQLSDEHKDKIRLGNQGKTVTAETRRRLSGSATGRKASPQKVAEQQKRAMGNSWASGHTVSPATRKRLSIATSEWWAKKDPEERRLFVRNRTSAQAERRANG
jgi:group I intron endonuclease